MPETRTRLFKDEMKAWEEWIKAQHEPLVELLTSSVLILACLLIPEGALSGQIGLALSILLTFQLALSAIVVRLLIGKMERVMNEHFQETKDLLRDIEPKRK